MSFKLLKAYCVIDEPSEGLLRLATTELNSRRRS
jgi:hypothetical protein